MQFLPAPPLRANRIAPRCTSNIVLVGAWIIWKTQLAFNDQTIPSSIGAMASPRNPPALRRSRGAVAGRFMNVLVTDEDVAAALLRRPS